MGTKYLPTVIDYILQTTGADQIFYAGHSMGTTMFYVLCAQRPEFNSKIRAMFSLAPAAFMSHMKSPLIQLTAMISGQHWVSCQLIYNSVITLFTHDTNKYTFYINNKYNLLNKANLVHNFSLYVYIYESLHFPPCIPDSHPHRITSTKCRTNTVVSLDGGPIFTRNMQIDKYKHAKENCE
jgi:pimeloyl-ACP methyl ester carboxylesterase